jgi:hypothetical protein
LAWSFAATARVKADARRAARRSLLIDMMLPSEGVGAFVLPPVSVALPVLVYVVCKHGHDKANWINRSAVELDKSQCGRSVTSHRT